MQCIKLLTRLRPEFSHLNEDKFRYNFKDTLNPICACVAELGTTELPLVLSIILH